MKEKKEIKKREREEKWKAKKSKKGKMWNKNKTMLTILMSVECNTYPFITSPYINITVIKVNYY